MKKSLAINYLYNVVYKIFVIIVPLITTPHITRVLYPESVGINSYINSIINIFTTLGLLGLTNYSIREIAYVKNNKRDRSKVFYELFIIRIILSVITTLCYIGYSFIEYNYQQYFIIYLFTIIGTFLDTAWYYQGKEEFRFTTIRSFIVKTISTISIFVLVRTPDDLPILMMIYSLTTIVSAVTLLFPLRRDIEPFTKYGIDIKKHFLPCIKLFLPQVAIMLYCQLDKVMITNITGELAQTGFYNQAEKLVNIPLAVITSLSAVLLPRISEEFASKNVNKVKYYISKAINLNLMLALPLTAGIAGVASGLIPWFLGDNYLQVIPILIILSMNILPLALSEVSGNQYLTAINDTKTLTISYFAGAIIDIILNFLLIPSLHACGAAIATVLTNYVVVSIQYAHIRFIQINNVLKDCFKYIIASALVLTICTLLNHVLRPSYILTALQITIAGLVYFALLLLLRDQYLLSNIYKFFHKQDQKKKRILLIAPKLSVGGMERALISLIKSSFQEHYQITLMLVYVTDESYLDELPSNVKVIVFSKNKKHFYKIKSALGLIYAYFRSFLMYGSYDASICYSYHHGILARIARNFSKNNIVFIHTDLALSRNSDEIKKLDRRMEFLKFAKIVCVSKSAKDSFLKIFPNCNKDNIAVIYNIIDDDRIVKLSKEFFIQKDNSKITFLNVSRHDNDNNKKISRIIKSAEKLKNEGIVNFLIRLIGDGAEHEKYIKSIKRAGLEDCFEILGKQDNPYPYYIASDILIMSSMFEGYGIVLDEAKVLHVPIISTDVADAKYVVNEPKYGFICKNSEDGVYQAMKKAIKTGIPNTVRYKASNHNKKNIIKLCDFIEREQ